jgi:TPR repeat protein
VASSGLSEAGASAAAHALPAASLVADAQGAPKLDPSALIARGDEFLRQSDVISARLFYRLAAANGSAAGAIAMGSTYDPVFLERNAVRGVKPEPRKALEWYQTAVELGDPGGKTRSAELLNVLRIDAARGDAQARAILEKAIQ